MSSDRSSLANQSHRLFEYANRIGQSRHAAKRNGTAQVKIFNRETKHSYATNFTRVLRFARQRFGLRRAADLNADMVAAFVQTLHQRGIAASTIAKYQSIINKADAVMRSCGWKPKSAPPLLPPEPKAPRERADPLPYTSDEADALIEWLSKLREVRFAQLATVQRHAGLRVQEAVMLRAQAISEGGDRISLIRGDGQKGGRPREVMVFDKDAQALLRELQLTALRRARKRIFIESDSTKKIKAFVRSYQRALQLAAEALELGHSKTHDLRRTFANEMFLRLKHMGLEDKAAGRVLSTYLGHGESRMEKGLLGSYLAMDQLSAFRPAGIAREIEQRASRPMSSGKWF